MKGGVELGGVVSTLTKNEDVAESHKTLPKKCRDPEIFFVPCTIGECTFVEVMLDLGASINVMPTSIYKSMNFGDLKHMGMTIQLENRIIVQPLGVLEDVLVQVNDLIFPANFYVLDMKDETSRKGSTLILGRSMEFDDNLVQFNMFEAMKHSTKDPSLFGIDVIDELVVEYTQLKASSAEFSNFSTDIDVIDYLGSVIDESDYDELLEVQDLSDSEDDIVDLANSDLNSELIDLIDRVCKYDEESECSKHAKAQVVETKKLLQAQVSNCSNHLGAESDSDNQSRKQLKAETNLANQPRPVIDTPPLHSPPIELKPLLGHLKQHKKAIGWRLSNLPGINPSICMHNILMEEEAHPIRQQQRRMNLTILDVVKKDHLSHLRYPVQVVLKKSRMTIMKNQHDELVPMQIQNSWRATCKYYFHLPFIDQVLEKLAGKSHYCFLDGFSRYMQIHIAPEDQHKTTFTCPFGTFAYTRMPFGLCNAPSTFQRCMMSIFSDLIQDCMEVFIDDFTVYATSFDACLENLSLVLTRCINTNLVLNFEKFHFMVIEGIVLGHLVSSKGIKVDKSKIDIITSLPNPTFVREVHSFLGHVGFYRRFIKNFSKIALPFSNLLQKDVDFNFDQPCIEAF
ncbi:Retrovirus-related Pol polyprotein from transposon 17.6, partial [Mucuna pruriens]